jgi:hypothetical protein
MRQYFVILNIDTYNDSLIHSNHRGMELAGPAFLQFTALNNQLHAPNYDNVLKPSNHVYNGHSIPRSNRSAIPPP